MKTKTELDERFEYKDSDTMTVNLLLLCATIFILGIITGTAIIMIAARYGFFDFI